MPEYYDKFIVKPIVKVQFLTPGRELAAYEANREPI